MTTNTICKVYIICRTHTVFYGCKYVAFARILCWVKSPRIIMREASLCSRWGQMRRTTARHYTESEPPWHSARSWDASISLRDSGSPVEEEAERGWAPEGMEGTKKIRPSESIISTHYDSRDWGSLCGAWMTPPRMGFQHWEGKWTHSLAPNSEAFSDW